VWVLGIAPAAGAVNACPVTEKRNASPRETALVSSVPLALASRNIQAVTDYDLRGTR